MTSTTTSIRVSAFPIANIDETYLSFAIDTSYMLGGWWWGDRHVRFNPTIGANRIDPADLSHAQLIRYAKALGPSILRVGGTEADTVWYDIDHSRKKPNGCRLTLTKKRWEEILTFAEAIDARILFTLNAAKHVHTASLIQYTRNRTDRIAAWEFGNEVNAYPVTHIHRLRRLQYIRDLAVLRTTLNEHGDGKIAAFGSIIWPVIGEPFSYLKKPLSQTEQLLMNAAHPDIITWHYYPQQSTRCPMRTCRASAQTLLSPKTFIRASHYAEQIHTWTQKYAHADVWLGETGPALCGGEPGLSQSFFSSLWWLIHLGEMAKHHQSCIIRQTLIGSDYGLIDDNTMQPNPDYWTSLLWKRLMGQEVLDVQIDGPEELRVYGHRNPKTGQRCFLLINTHPTQPFSVHLSEGTKTLYHLSNPNLLENSLYLNNKVVQKFEDIKGLKMNEHEIHIGGYEAVFIQETSSPPN